MMMLFIDRLFYHYHTLDLVSFKRDTQNMVSLAVDSLSEIDITNHAQEILCMMYLQIEIIFHHAITIPLSTSWRLFDDTKNKPNIQIRYVCRYRSLV